MRRATSPPSHLLTPPALRTSPFGAQAVAVGSAALARYRVTRPLDVQRIERSVRPGSRPAGLTLPH